MPFQSLLRVERFWRSKCGKGKLLESLVLGLRSKIDGRLYEEPTPNLFSFNSRKEHVPNVEVLVVLFPLIE